MRGRNKVMKHGLIAAGLLSALCAEFCFAVKLPAGPLADLKSEEFGKREAAQEELLAWARLQPEAVMDELFQQSRVADDPEVRGRCLAVLRKLVDDEYSKDGEGFIGIEMRDEELVLPGNAKSRGVIRVTRVVRDSAAAKAGLQLNDLILGFDDHVWDEKLISLPFREQIRQLKPNSKIKLNLMRKGKLLSLPVTLGRRPPMVDNLPFGERVEDPAAVEQAAKDNYFRHWLERRKAGK
jgi:hypothetical protein